VLIPSSPTDSSSEFVNCEGCLLDAAVFCSVLGRLSCLVLLSLSLSLRVQKFHFDMIAARL
jgi:hypothetical protein